MFNYMFSKSRIFFTFLNLCVLFLFKVGQDELELKAKIGQIWENLFQEARQVDLSLADVKKSFSVVRYHTTDR